MTPNRPTRSGAYKLGRIAFAIKDGNPTFLNQLDILLPQYTEPCDEIENIGEGDLRNLHNRIFELHKGCLWLDAGCLISPNGKKVLIIGRSGAGKSTTTLALALSQNWKVIAEDVLLIDFIHDQLITFGSPFSLKPGTVELLRDSIGRVPDPIIAGEWSPLGKMAAPSDEDAHFDICFAFSRSGHAQTSGITVTNLTSAEFFRKCLPVSNVLRMNGAGEKLLEYTNKAQCLEIVDGTLSERLNKILQLCR